MCVWRDSLLCVLRLIRDTITHKHTPTHNLTHPYEVWLTHQYEMWSYLATRHHKSNTHTYTHTYTEYREGVWSARRVPHINTYEWCTHANTYTHTQAYTFIHPSEVWSTLGTHTAYPEVLWSDHHVSGLSCLTCESVMSHIWKSHVTQILLLKSLKVSCPTHESVMSHKYRCYSCWWFFISYCARNIAKSHITHWLNVSCHTYESGISCIWMRLVSHLWMKSRHTHTRGIVVNSFMSHIYMSHVTHILLLKLLMGSRLPHKWVMSHKYRSYSRWWCAISCRARHRAESHKAHEQVVFHIRSRHVAHIKWSCRA